MGIARRQQHVAQTLQLGVRHHRVEELPAHAFPSMLRHYEHVAEPREGRAIGDHSRERYLRGAAFRVAGERRETDGSIDRSFQHIAWHTGRPVRIVVKETPHEVAVDVPRFARNDVLPHVRRV